MRWPGRNTPPGRADADKPERPNAAPVRLAQQLALATVAYLALTFLLSASPQFLMPGPLSSAHSSIETCSSCHANTGSGKLSWIQSFAGGAPPHADSKACLTCHKMPDTALNAHGAAADVLKTTTERLTKVAARTTPPLTARAQSRMFPTHAMAADGLSCATCHQEHQGAAFDLKAITNEQCRSCHAVKFDSFDGHHPKFDSYPFDRRTRIIYDHAGHFDKHYPELAKKEPSKTIPATCSTCHVTSADKRIMSVAPFDKTCSTCHLDQITGKERASGPKGIAFLSLPGLDVETLRRKGENIGEWPADSEAPLTAFMKVIIGRSQRGGAALASLANADLQDLSAASDEQIKAAGSLVWEIKRLFHEMISGRIVDVLADLSIGDQTKFNASAIADLTASIPRDVIAGAQQQWLPNLAKEMAGRPDAGDRKRSGSNQTMLERKTMVLAFMRSTMPEARLRPFELAQAGDGNDDHGEQTLKRRALPSGTPRSIEARDSEKPEEKKAKAKKPEDDATPDGAAGATENDAEAKAATEAATDASSTDTAPPSDPGSQTDELLAPNEAELREIKAREKGAPPSAPSAVTQNSDTGSGKAAPEPAAKEAQTGSATTPTAAEATASEPAAAASPSGTIESDVDPESWAETGGWYRQDYAIYYRPAGHKDKFIASWLITTGPSAAKDGQNSAAAVFNALTGKDAQGSCTKCHSVDDVSGRGRTVNFSPLQPQMTAGRFTRFLHEPHFGLVGERGCLTCHTLKTERPDLKSYEQGDPHILASNFGSTKKEVCQTCHAKTLARQDCVLCHAYHVNGVSTPIISTKIPVR
jgi:hypothetical protein